MENNKGKTAGQESVTAAVTSRNDSAEKSQVSFWKHPISWFWYKQDSSSKSAPLMRTAWAIALLIGGFAVNEAYAYLHNKVVDPDQYIKTLSANQDRSFQELKDGLNRLGNAVGSGDREALKLVEAASRDIRNANSGLLQQLALAKRENDRLSSISGQQAGVQGGYDFMLTENTGLALDKGSVLGVQSIHKNVVYANLSATNAPTGTKSLNSGESLEYQNSAGASCKVTLLSISGDNGAASFSNSCTG